MGTLSAFFTAFYSYRLLLLTFFTKPLGYKQLYLIVHESPIMMVVVLVILSLLSILVGYTSKDFFIGPGTDFWGNSLCYNDLNKSVLGDSEFLVPLYVKLLPTLCTFAGSGLSLCIFTQNPRFCKGVFKKSLCFGGNVYLFLNKKWFFDKVFNQHLFGQQGLSFGLRIALKTFDKGFIEYFGPRKFSGGVLDLLLVNKKIQSGRLYNYIVDFFFGFVFLSIGLLGLTSSYNIYFPIMLPFCAIIFYCK